ncbi:1,4-dihydroxy-2-naphthoate prenyltransferase [Bernardetia litoralis DSM 6794]|uniref:1,4-dihydroxy-2-naphthoate octaprenyltransferase n=1 Tax=Bernardetia litoralis (strain ATCC 23117 / DSM 6794 / NBRC 15988 / NCIMB 1366 / Fx l1 / Sio-4) TaxID=880071 RepID=I4AJL1_BERLS|nr:1,4-dihydroxy-2-naphthoate polyprenyltransferase [Bernardetia litoralis]AFM04146.1 1,4-dihydroxy-2-naphthoate prenyltransferase [Bernardetia litoralis DSM 6794]
MNLKAWIEAARLRTLPLALASMLMGCFLAVMNNFFDIKIASLTILTAILLQILSNYANDYGDSIHGADHKDRVGPKRAVQEGKITSSQMKKAVILFSILSFMSGVLLLFMAIDFQSENSLKILVFFLGLGLFCIAGAILYTAGKKPYGYMGLGDIAVLIFFGWVAGGGTYFLQAQASTLFDFQTISWDIFLPATSCGLFAVGVLNLNNIRDIKSDILAGKNSIPVRIGKEKANIYHALVIIGAWLSAILFLILNYQKISNLIFLIILPLFIWNIIQVFKRKDMELDPLLKQLAISTLFFVILFGISFIL